MSDVAQRQSVSTADNLAVQLLPANNDPQKHIAILDGTLSQSFPGAIDWQAASGRSHVPVLSACWMAFDADALSTAGRYLVFRIASIEGIRPGNRVRYDRQSYAICGVEKG